MTLGLPGDRFKKVLMKILIVVSNSGRHNGTSLPVEKDFYWRVYQYKGPTQAQLINDKLKRGQFYSSDGFLKQQCSGVGLCLYSTCCLRTVESYYGTSTGVWREFYFASRISHIVPYLVAQLRNSFLPGTPDTFCLVPRICVVFFRYPYIILSSLPLLNTPIRPKPFN